MGFQFVRKHYLSAKNNSKKLIFIKWNKNNIIFFQQTKTKVAKKIATALNKMIENYLLRCVFHNFWLNSSDKFSLLGAFVCIGLHDFYSLSLYEYPNCFHFVGWLCCFISFIRQIWRLHWINNAKHVVSTINFNCMLWPITKFPRPIVNWLSFFCSLFVGFIVSVCKASVRYDMV